MALNGIRSGVLEATFYRKKDNKPLGYMVLLDSGKRVIVHPKSIINAETTQH